MKIVQYDPKYQPAFRQLNLDWINKYFEVEVEDEKVLNDPVQFILNPGGRILLLENDQQIIGTCALIHQGDKIFQLAKMAVDEKFQGKGGGKLLIEEAIQQFKEMNGIRLFLYSNSRLVPAINLYRKYGFRDKPLTDAIHRRSDTFMEYHG